MATFEASSFFTIGWVRSEEQGRELARSMPDTFQKNGHFTIDAHPNRYGLHGVHWDCHKLDQKRHILNLPFEVLTPEDVANGRFR